MNSRLLLLLCLFSFQSLLFADSRDDDILGSSPSSSTTDELASRNSSFAESNLLIGGRLQLETSSLRGLGAEKMLPSQQNLFYLHVDARPNEEVRAFIRARILDNNSALSSQQGTQISIDQSWIKTNLNKKFFLTLGRQHVKWGVGKFWNPTDFLREIKDPFASYDKRLGSDLIKMHYPLEKENSNFYAIMDFNHLSTQGDPGFAWRAEWLKKQTEFSFSLYSRQNAPIRLAADFSSGLDDFDIYSELVLSTQNRNLFYRKRAGGDFEAYERKNEMIAQGLFGLSYIKQYSDEDSVTLGFEYFYNDLGHDERELELLAFMTRQASPLYLGKHYAGLYAMFPYPGSWNHSSIFINTLGNLTDQSAFSRVSLQHELNREILVDLWVSASWGAKGEFRYRIPESSVPIGSDQGSPLLVSSLDRALGVTLSMHF
ncbi:MAG: hypothetical protein KA436_04190 [Oligoflexales bacterium]|nr:hypothetical protein [Oligoflexales bacterium]